jgi:hypothetical protein
VKSNRIAQKNEEKEANARPHRARLPGFVIDHEVGLGDAIRLATYAIGIKPCGGCERRAAALNRWMVFSPFSRHRS